jgi:hypothetical protein
MEDCVLASQVRNKVQIEEDREISFTSSIARAGTFAWIDMSSMTYQSHKKGINFFKNKKVDKSPSFYGLRSIQVWEQSGSEKVHPTSSTVF